MTLGRPSAHKRTVLYIGCDKKFCQQRYKRWPENDGRWSSGAARLRVWFTRSGLRCGHLCSGRGTHNAKLGRALPSLVRPSAASSHLVSILGQPSQIDFHQCAQKSKSATQYFLVATTLNNKRWGLRHKYRFGTSWLLSRCPLFRFRATFCVFNFQIFLMTMGSDRGTGEGYNGLSKLRQVKCSQIVCRIRDTILVWICISCSRVVLECSAGSSKDDRSKANQGFWELRSQSQKCMGSGRYFSIYPNTINLWCSAVQPCQVACKLKRRPSTLIACK